MYNSEITKSSNWLYKKFIREKLDNAIGYVLLTFISAIVAFIIGKFGFSVAISACAIAIALPILLNCVIDYRFGILLTIVYGYFMFTMARLIQIDLPIGSIPDVFLFFSLIGILRAKPSQPLISSYFNNKISCVFFIWIAYGIFQLFNPFGSVTAWLFYLKEIISFTIFYIAAIYIFDSYSFVKQFTKLWIALSLLAALYCFHQEFVGFFNFEYDWIYSNESRYDLIYIWGRFRKWSFLADVSSFGLFMSFSGIFCLVLALGPFKLWQRAGLIIGGLLMLIAMNYSGSRTATAMVPVGIALFSLMTIKNVNTLLFIAVSSLLFLGLFFGPFYGKNMHRLRSTFQPSDDPSMNLREYNRQRIQPYIYTHPIGGGVGTSGVEGLKYAPGHPLAGFPPDSKFLRTVIEMGWIGLIIEMSLFFTVLAVGIKNYFKTKNLKIKYLYAAYISAFFALTIANYAQDSMLQKPMCYVVLAAFVLMFRLKDFDDK